MRRLNGRKCFIIVMRSSLWSAFVPPEVAISNRWFLEAVVGRFDIPLFRAYARGVERKTLPGISVHNVIRKRWIEDKWGITRAALPAFLKSHSFSTKEVVRVRDFLPSYVAAEHVDMVLPEGENPFCAEREH